MTTTEGKFLQEIAQLLARHGPEPFLQLAERLENPTTRDQMIATLRGLAEAAPSRPKMRSRTHLTPTQRTERLIDEIGKHDPGRGRSLEEARAQLVLLPKVQLFEIASRLRVEFKDREHPSVLIASIVRALAELDSAGLKREVHSYSDYNRHGAGELSAWNDVITGHSGRRAPEHAKK